MTIWFDMDGTIANLYAVDGWLADLRAERTRPYELAAVMLNMSQLARQLNKLQRLGYKLGIISWTAKNGNASYNAQVASAKLNWLNKHLHSVKWDAVKIVPYGTDKKVATGGGILFDDEEPNRTNWGNNAYDPKDMMEILRAL
jgi:hypothetical protein